MAGYMEGLGCICWGDGAGGIERGGWMRRDGDKAGSLEVGTPDLDA